MDREKALAFMAEMMKKFTEDNVPELMRNREVEKCEELAYGYAADPRFEEVAMYAIEEGSLEATVAEFDISNLMNVLMLFYCFDNEYDGCDFNELYIISEETFVEFVRALAASKDDVAKETAELLGLEYGDDPAEYSLDESEYYLTDLTMEVLIDYDCPEEYDEEEDDDTSDEGDKDSEHQKSKCNCEGNGDCKCDGSCGSGCTCKEK